MITFERKKISALSGLTEVHFTCNDKENGMYSIIANQMGVRMEGKSPIFYSMDELEPFAQALGTAWEEHLKLKPKLSKTLSGH